jgi:hypothetical protein
MEKYLYLTKHEWALTWVNGGIIPILPASTYLSKERSGTMTPDENRIHNSPVDVTKLPGIKFSEGAGVKNLTYTGNVFNGVKAPDVVNAQYYLEDGLILSFCNIKSRSIAQRLGKKACVKILNIHSLKYIIDEQLGVDGISGICDYTHDHNRNHFLKYNEDSWQNEYRIFWPLTEPRKVKIPKGTAVKIKLKI